MTLNSLKNSTRKKKPYKRCGRGPGSKIGKTCGRGEKGAGARAGYKRRLGYEGGQMRLHMKTPTRGFNNIRFNKKPETVNLLQVNEFFNDGDLVNLQTLREHGLVSNKAPGVKILAEGEIKKKVTFEVDAFSAGAREKLHKAKIEIKDKSEK